MPHLHLHSIIKPDLTPTYPTSSPSSLTTNPPTLCTNLNVQSVKPFCIGEKSQILSKCMNGHQSTCVITNADPTTANSIVHEFPDVIPNHVHCKSGMAYQLVLQARQSPSINMH